MPSEEVPWGLNRAPAATPPSHVPAVSGTHQSASRRRHQDRSPRDSPPKEPRIHASPPISPPSRAHLAANAAESRPNHQQSSPRDSPCLANYLAERIRRPPAIKNADRCPARNYFSRNFEPTWPPSPDRPPAIKNAWCCLPQEPPPYGTKPRVSSFEIPGLRD